MSAENKIIVHHYVDVGVNFPYYVLARTNLRISPFAQHDNAYAEIHQKYLKFEVDWDSVPRIRDVWWDWLWRVGFNGPYESAQQTIAHIHSEEEDAESIAAVEKLISVANSLMHDYVQQKRSSTTISSVQPQHKAGPGRKAIIRFTSWD